MNGLPKAFAVVNPPTVTAMIKAVDGLRRLLEALTSGQAPALGFSDTDLHAFCRSAVTGQRGSLGRTQPGSWSVAANDAGMPADARVDFVFTPTYIVVAILTSALQRFPRLASDIHGYEDALRRGMEFAMLRGLQGHGVEAVEGAADARRILRLGGVDRFLRRHPDFCPALAEALE
ncbi:hypothetical protein [Azospirillum brasilense]|uniref:hypothetical protein n=1 Tax=Azospirillum brasilense TaxID=192 RepID=UPI001ED9F82C|nr:hypothetical protein [Azospirillum brasilense]UKJ75402.1 hypothetical protein H1Q64_14170 [Azospirillum brasilense]